MAMPFRSRGAVPSLFVRQLFDRQVIGKQVNLTSRRVVAETQLEVPIRLPSRRCAGKKQIPVTHQERGLNITEVCGDGLTQFSAVVHYEVGAFSSEGPTPGVLHHWTSTKYSRRPFHRRFLNHRIGFDAP
jgi:hypothetical protein